MKKTNAEYIFVFKIVILSTLLILVALAFWFVGSFMLPEPAKEEVLCVDKVVYTVILDAGHGGGDPGANVGDVYEKDLNLQIVNKIKKFLYMYELNVVLTRSDDSLLADSESKNKKREDLLNRVRVAEQYDTPVFVSIHMNKFPEQKYSGLQVFYSPNAPYSEALALKLQSNNRKYLETDNGRMVKRSDSSIYLLDRLLCPAVLVECGFLSNETDRSKLCDEEYQNQLAFVIANSIIEYIGL